MENGSEAPVNWPVGGMPEDQFRDNHDFMNRNFENDIAIINIKKMEKTTANQPLELMTTKEVAVLLSVTDRTIANYRKKGVLPYTKLGGKIYYRRADIQSIFKQRA